VPDTPLLRIYLFAGLFLHKLVWEILKRKDRVAIRRQNQGRTGLLMLVKAAKIVALGFLIVQTLFLKLFPITDKAAALRITGLGIYTLGLVVAIAGRLNLGKNWVDLEDRQALPGQSVVTHGIYRFIRHPIYAGDMLLVLGLELSLNSWLVMGVPFFFLVVLRHTLAEEAMLTAAFPDYQAYRRRTKRFVPFLF
jgi:protein-S-isoprenylcysteine O-methyltransferase Ste14